MANIIGSHTHIERDFEKDAAEILKNSGMHLRRDGRWCHFRPERFRDLTWGDIREFLERNYPAERLARMNKYLEAVKKAFRQGKGDGTLFKGNDAIVGYAEIPRKLLFALRNDYPVEFGGYDMEDYASPDDQLKNIEGSTALNCFMVAPTRERRE